MHQQSVQTVFSKTLIIKRHYSKCPSAQWWFFIVMLDAIILKVIASLKKTLMFEQYFFPSSLQFQMYLALCAWLAITLWIGFHRENLMLKDTRIFAPQDFSPWRKKNPNPEIRDNPHGHQ
jgi:hypothetical protein